MGVNLVTLALAKKYIDEVIAGVAVIEGADCRIKSITKEDNKNIVTFEWERSDGTTTTSTMTVKDGATPTSVTVDENNHIIFTMDDGTELDGGIMPATDVAISKVANNKLVNKPDGLYVDGKIETIDNDLNVNGTVAATIFAASDSITSNGKDVAVVDDIPQISEETGNAIVEKDDGWFVPTSGSEVDNLTVNGDLSVVGASTFSGRMQANTNSDFYDTVNMHGEVTIESLTVNGTSTFNNDVTIDANLTLTGTGYLTADTINATDEVIANTAQVTNDFTVGGTTTLDGETTINNNFTVANGADSELTGNVRISGPSLTVSNSSVFYDNVTIDGNTTIEHDLYVTGDTNFTLTPKVNKDDNLVDVAVVDDIPKISEEDGNAIVEKDDGWYVSSSGGIVDDLEVTGTLTVGGTSKFNDSVTVDGDVTLEGTSNFTADTINANTELNAKDVSISDTLGVTNDVTIGGSVTIDADSSINADLTVTGSMILKDDLNMSDGQGDIILASGRTIYSGDNAILVKNDDNGDMELNSPNNIKITSSNKGVNINSTTDSTIQSSAEMHVNGANGVYLRQANEYDNSQLYLDTDGWFGVEAKEEAKIEVRDAGDIVGVNHTLKIDGAGLTYDGKEIPTIDKVMAIPEYNADSIKNIGTIYATYNWTFFKNLGFSKTPYPYGRDVWTDGEKTYLTLNLTTAYVWDEDNNKWSDSQIPITNGTRFYGRSVFEYNGDIYYSDSEGAGKFNRATHMFDKITFKYSGSKPVNVKALYGEKMFVLNGELYFSHNVKDYVFNDTYSSATQTASEILKLSSDGVTWVDADFGIPLFPSGEYAWIDKNGVFIIGNNTAYYRYNSTYNRFDPIYMRERLTPQSSSILRGYVINGSNLYRDEFGNIICSKDGYAYILDNVSGTTYEWKKLTSFKYSINGIDVFKTSNGLTLLCTSGDNCYMFKPGMASIADILSNVALYGRYSDLTNRPSVRIPARLTYKSDKVNVGICMNVSAEYYDTGMLTIVDENDPSVSGNSHISIYDIASSHFDNWNVYPSDNCIYPAYGYWYDAYNNKHIAMCIKDLDYGDDGEKTGDENYNDYFEFTIEAQDGETINLYCDFQNSQTNWRMVVMG